MEIFSPLFALQAEELLLMGDYKTAETMCREGLHHYPDYVAAQSLLALSLIKQNKTDEAHSLAETLNARSKKAAEAIRANLNNDSILQLYVDKEEISTNEMHDTDSWDEFEEILVDTQKQSDIKNTDSEVSELSDDSIDNLTLETEETPDEVADEEDIHENIETVEEIEIDEEITYSADPVGFESEDIYEPEQEDEVINNDEVADEVDIPESIETVEEIETKEEITYSADPVGFESEDIYEPEQEDEVINNDEVADEVDIPETDNIKEDVDIIDEYSLISSLYEVESDKVPSADQNDIGIVPGFETILQDDLLSVLEADIFDDSKSITDELSELAKKLENSSIPIEHNEEDDEPEENEYRSEVISETLAKIYEMQGAYNDAITAYRKLAEIEPSRKEVYEEKIENILSKINNG